MIELQDELIIDLFKKLDLKSAVRLASTAKHYFNLFKNNEENLWEHYLNRDFPTAPWPLNKDYKKAYLINRLSKVIDFIQDPDLQFTKIEAFTPLKQRILAITDMSTLEELSNLHLQLTRAVSAGNIVDSNGCTPLHKAASGDKAEITQLLIGAGANLNAVHNSGFTPLCMSAFLGKTEIVRILLQAGADPNIAVEGLTPLYLAICGGHTEIVKDLLRSRADPNITEDTGETSLVLAAERGKTEIVQALIGAGAKVIIAKVSGKIPLIIAAEKCLTEIAEALIQAGADVTVSQGFDCTGDYFFAPITPLHRARHKHYKPIINLLENVIIHKNAFSTVKPMLFAKAKEIQQGRDSEVADKSRAFSNKS